MSTVAESERPFFQYVNTTSNPKIFIIFVVGVGWYTLLTKILFWIARFPNPRFCDTNRIFHF